MRFIDEHVGNRADDGLRSGVESICAQLTELGAKIAPSTYYAHRDRPLTAGEVRDTDLKPKVAEAYAENCGVYDARKVWLTLNRERPHGAPPIARCTVERLMTELGLRAAVRGKVKRTTISNPHAAKPHDLVDRNFSPVAPDRLWVADFTDVSTWSPLVLHRVRHRRLRPADPGLVGGDHGVQYLSVAYSEHLATAGIKPSTGAVGSSYDCETVGCRLAA